MMDGNNWRPAQAEPNSASNSNMDGGDWRTQLSPESRKRIIKKIMETLNRHLPISGPDGLVELKKIAVRFEEKIYTAATSQTDYLRKISLKMLTMENKSQPGGNNVVQSNSGGANQNPSDPASHGIQQQVRNPGQSLQISSQQRQQLLQQNLQNTIASTGVQSSASMTSAMPSLSGLSQSGMSNVVAQNSDLQSMSGISQNSVGNSVGQVSSNMFANSQRPMPGRQHQQQVATQQQQSQNPQLILYPHQIQQQLLKQKLQQQGNMHPSLLQSHIQQQQQQQQLQSNQMQPSQQSLMQMSSSHQSSQPLQQVQPSMMQSAPQSALQQNQQSSVQQSAPSVLQQHQQSVLRQQQQSQQTSVHQQPSVLHQQTPISQQPMLPSQQQQQLMGQQPNATNIQQNQLLGPQNSVPDMQQQQQQRLLAQQNNLSNMQQHQPLLTQQNISNLHQQQQLVAQSSISGLQQQQQLQQLAPQSNVSGLQQQQLLGSQPSVSNMQQNQHSMHLLQQQQAKVAVQQQQQNQQASSTVLPSQGQQSQPQQPQQQLMSQLQSQPQQLQQQLAMQQQPNSLQRETQRRIQTSSALLQSQPQNAIDQQRQLYQPQRGLPEASSTPIDSTTGVVDWQEEIFQKIKSMKEMYLAELTELFQKFTLKCRQHEALMQQEKSADQMDRVKMYRSTIENLIQFLQVPKSYIRPSLKEKLVMYEKHILHILTLNKKKTGALQQQGQQQIQQSGGQMHSISLQPQTQIPQLQQHENHVNQMQPMNLPGSVTSMQSSTVTSMQHGSMPLPTSLGVTTSQQNMMNTLQPASNLKSAQGNALSSIQHGVMGSLQQNCVGSLQQNAANATQQSNVSTLSQSSVNQLQPNINTLQQNSNFLQHQHLKQQQQEQQLMQTQLKQQFQQHQMQQQQLIHPQQKQQLLQQQPQQFQAQQLHQQQKQQQSAQSQAHQMPQLHQMNEVNELKVRQGAGPGVKPGLFQQHHQASQRSAYHQQLKSGASFPISSPQLVQAASPQISQHSPQVDQQNLLTSMPKAGTPSQSANSPFIVPSPSTPLAPSPILGDPEKQPSGISTISNAGSIGHQQSALPLSQAQSIAIGTPGISASPLLAEFTSVDGHQGSASAGPSCKSSATERPLERLIRVVKSMSTKALGSSVSDIGSVVSMIDRIAGSAPGNGSRAAVGEDLVAMTKCRLQARNFMSQDGNSATKKMRRHTSAMPLNAVSSAGSVNNSFKQLYSLETDMESTATSRIKRHRVEANLAVLEEIREINQHLIDTVVEISEEDVDLIAAEGEGTIVKCSFGAVAVSPSLKSQYASAQMSPISPLRLLIPSNYPNCSPVLLDKLPIELSKESEDLSMKAKSSFNISLRGLSQPVSLGEMARTWDICARKAISEYAQRSGGGSFSSRYGTWESCVSA